MKACSKCKASKPLTEFNFKVKTKGIYSYQCRSCSRLYVKQHYYENKQYYLDKAKKRNLNVQREVRSFIIKYLKNNPCVDCNEKDILVLEFDHRENKFLAVSKMVHGRYSLDTVKEEVKKCEVRCANCHRRKTALQFGWFKNENASVA